MNYKEYDIVLYLLKFKKEFVLKLKKKKSLKKELINGSDIIFITAINSFITPKKKKNRFIRKNFL